MASEPLVITFADSRYRPLLEVWLEKLVRLRVPRVRIYALDAPLLAWCRAQGLDAEPEDWHGDLRELWSQRIRVFGALLAQGEQLVHSDADALWVRNALDLDAVREPVADLLFSQGTVWPPDVHARWGFVLCCGWFRARPTPAVQAFFRSLERDVRISGDDQVSVNRLLAAARMRWDRGAGPDYQLEFHGKALQCWTRPLNGASADHTMSVALLPHREFQRLPEQSESAVVKHLLTPKRCDEKLAVFRQHGLIP